MKERADLPIVVVEDDPLTLSLFESLLEHQGFRTPLLFDNSTAALHFVERNDAAVIILDLNLPDMPGQELLRRITSRRPGIPVVIVSGVHQVETAIECMKEGAVDYVTKPFTVSRLTSSLTRALALHRAREEGAPTIPEARQGQGGLPSPAEGVPERLKKAAAYMEENLSRPLYLEAIAQEACLSKFHFCREFKRFFGVTPIQYVLQRRIARATSLLRGKETSISQVAMLCGFSDQSEFTKWFKKTMGLTPSSYRKLGETSPSRERFA